MRFLRLDLVGFIFEQAVKLLDVLSEAVEHCSGEAILLAGQRLAFELPLALLHKRFPRISAARLGSADSEVSSAESHALEVRVEQVLRVESFVEFAVAIALALVSLRYAVADGKRVLRTS